MVVSYSIQSQCINGLYNLFYSSRAPKISNGVQIIYWPVTQKLLKRKYFFQTRWCHLYQGKKWCHLLWGPLVCYVYDSIFVKYYYKPSIHCSSENTIGCLASCDQNSFRRKAILLYTTWQGVFPGSTSEDPHQKPSWRKGIPLYTMW